MPTLVSSGRGSRGHVYRYLPYSTVGNLPVEPGELPLDVQSIRWGRRGGPEELRGTLSLVGQETPLDSLVDATDPYRRSLHVERDGVLIWGGIITSALDNDDGTAIDITVMGWWEGYFARQPIASNLYWLATDPLVVARGLISWWQGLGASFDVGVVVGTEVGAQPVDVIYPWSDLKPIGDAFSDLARGDKFGWSVDVAWEGTPKAAVRRLHLYPGRQGRRYPESGLYWERPGAILSSPWGRDAAGFANWVMVPGQGEGDLMPMGHALSSASLNAGYPLSVQVIPYKDQPSAMVLNNWAAAHLPAQLDLDVESSVTVKADADPQVGTYLPGDEARFSIRSPRFPDGLDIVKRIRTITLVPASSTSVETVTLDLDPLAKID